MNRRKGAYGTHGDDGSALGRPSTAGLPASRRSAAPATGADGHPVFAALPAGRGGGLNPQGTRAQGPPPHVPRIGCGCCLVLLAALLTVACLAALGFCTLTPIDSQPTVGSADDALVAAQASSAPVVPTGPMPSSFEGCTGAGGLVGYAQGALGVRATWNVPFSLPDTCEQVLSSYERQAGVTLRYSGYLDLLGNAWACVVAGPSWVEVVVVQEGGGEGADVGAHSQEGPSTLSVMRLGQEAIEQNAAIDEGVS